MSWAEGVKDNREAVRAAGETTACSRPPGSADLLLRTNVKPFDALENKIGL